MNKKRKCIYFFNNLLSFLFIGENAYLARAVFPRGHAKNCRWGEEVSESYFVSFI